MKLSLFHLLTRSLREPGGPCTKSMEVSESRMERVKFHSVYLNQLKNGQAFPFKATR